MTTTSGLQVPARPAPVPAGDRLLAGGRATWRHCWAGPRRVRRRRPGGSPGSRGNSCWAGCSARRSGWTTPRARPTGRRRDPAAGLAGEPAGPDLAGTVGGQRSRGSRRLACRSRPVDQGRAPARDDHGPEASRLGTGVILLVAGDALRPGLPLLLTFTSRHLAAEMARTRDPEGFGRLDSLCETVPDSPVATRAIRRITAIMAAKGGLVADITAGDCLEALHLMNGMFDRGDGLPASSHRLPLRCPGERAHVRDPRAAHGRADDRPVRHRLPAGPRPAGGLPDGTPAIRRLRHLAEPRATTRIGVLA